MAALGHVTQQVEHGQPARLRRPLRHALVHHHAQRVLVAGRGDVALAAGLLLCLQLVTAQRLGLAGGPTVVLLAGGCVAPALAAVLLGGWPLLRPPLVPFWSGWASSLLEVTAVSLAILAAGAVARRG